MCPPCSIGIFWKGRAMGSKFLRRGINSGLWLLCKCRKIGWCLLLPRFEHTGFGQRSAGFKAVSYTVYVLVPNSRHLPAARASDGLRILLRAPDFFRRCNLRCCTSHCYKPCLDPALGPYECHAARVVSDLGGVPFYFIKAFGIKAVQN